ncbi:hypothetical protein TYRP_008329 [Tyrophagus putrescentiae]|nr:hypothetical protein TYRP_008329 [Tyrophagus putrescentiae]
MAGVTVAEAVLSEDGRRLGEVAQDALIGGNVTGGLVEAAAIGASAHQLQLGVQTKDASAGGVLLLLAFTELAVQLHNQRQGFVVVFKSRRKRIIAFLLFLFPPAHPLHLFARPAPADVPEKPIWRAAAGEHCRVGQLQIGLGQGVLLNGQVHLGSLGVQLGQGGHRHRVSPAVGEVAQCAVALLHHLPVGLVVGLRVGRLLQSTDVLVGLGEEVLGARLRLLVLRLVGATLRLHPLTMADQLLRVLLHQVLHSGEAVSDGVQFPVAYQLRHQFAVDRLAPSTSETPLGAPLPAPVVLGITDDFSTTELCPDTALGSMLDDLATDDLAIDFGSSLIMRSGFSGTPKNLEPSRLPSVLPPSAVSALSSSLDTLTTDEATAEPLVADASFVEGAPDFEIAPVATAVTGEPEAQESETSETAEEFAFESTLLPALDWSSSFLGRAFEPSKPILINNVSFEEELQIKSEQAVFLVDNAKGVLMTVKKKDVSIAEKGQLNELVGEKKGNGHGAFGNIAFDGDHLIQPGQILRQRVNHLRFRHFDGFGQFCRRRFHRKTTQRTRLLSVVHKHHLVIDKHQLPLVKRYPKPSVGESINSVTQYFGICSALCSSVYGTSKRMRFLASNVEIASRLAIILPTPVRGFRSTSSSSPALPSKSSATLIRWAGSFTSIFFMRAISTWRSGSPLLLFSGAYLGDFPRMAMKMSSFVGPSKGALT